MRLQRADSTASRCAACAQKAERLRHLAYVWLFWDDRLYAIVCEGLVARSLTGPAIWGECELHGEMSLTERHLLSDKYRVERVMRLMAEAARTSAFETHCNVEKM